MDLAALRRCIGSSQRRDGDPDRSGRRIIAQRKYEDPAIVTPELGNGRSVSTITCAFTATTLPVSETHGFTVTAIDESSFDRTPVRSDHPLATNFRKVFSPARRTRSGPWIGFFVLHFRIRRRRRRVRRACARAARCRSAGDRGRCALSDVSRVPCSRSAGADPRVWFGA
jgi:hypothetical protein